MSDLYQKASSDKLDTWIQDLKSSTLIQCEVPKYEAFYSFVIISLFLWSSEEPTKGMGAMADAPSPLLPSVLPRCKVWWSPSLSTTCWRWDWAELLLFAPLAPGFHKSLFLTLKEWCGLQMQSGRAEASIGIYGKVIYTAKKGEGSKVLPVQYLSPHPSLRRITVSLLFLWGSAGLPTAISYISSELLFWPGSSV